MDDVLLSIVLERLDQAPLPDEASDLLLAALEGGDALSAQLAADPASRPVLAPGSEAPGRPAGAYLRSITVSGFRGIGPVATLEVAPGPGLTLVVGRNGSGKSSFAEALEVLLTGTVMRWQPPAPTVVRDGWRSKHAPDASEVRAEFLIEGSGPATVARSWEPGADLADSTAWCQRQGEKRGPLDELGWADALQEYRPFLSHSELEAFFGRPSHLHDLLVSVLGLEDLTAASGRLNAARKEREDALAATTVRLAVLRGRLEQLDDERAQACLGALSGKTWDIALAQSVATGIKAPDDNQLSALRRLAQLSVPSAEGVVSAVTGLRAAANGLESAAGTAAGRARTLAGLLDAALRHYGSYGDGDCPVCGRPGALTEEWKSATEEQAAQLRQEAAGAETAATAAEAAVRQAMALMLPVPAVLAGPELAGPELAGPELAGLDVSQAQRAWALWAGRPPGVDLSAPAGLRALAEHLETAVSALATAVANLAANASRALTARDDRWAPLAADVASWCADAEPVCEAARLVPSIKKARLWLTSATGELRDARLAPLADEARTIWALLRQESNVDLGALRLAGSSTQRKVELDVSLDGSPGAALGVMSQGEINALALSIFLPRTTMPQSPFRLLIIDDPVQAMDPAKVEGLARVLAQVATNRQVIVFTHDNRLAAAVRDLSIPASVLEVTRRPKSVVQIRPGLDPAERALDDAGALSADTAVHADVARRVIPGLCRTAVEAALTQGIWRQQLRARRTREEIEESLTDLKPGLTNLAALALAGDARQGAAVLPRLDRAGHVYADTFKALNRGAHLPHDGDLGQLISGSRKLAAKISEILA